MNQSSSKPPHSPNVTRAGAPPLGVLVDPKLRVAQPLEDLLEELIAAHERLLGQARQHRDALAAGHGHEDMTAVVHVFAAPDSPGTSSRSSHVE